MIKIIFYSYSLIGIIVALSLIQDKLEGIFDSFVDCLAKCLLFLIFLVCWPLFIYLKIKQKFFPAPAPDRKPYTVPMEWLTMKLSISEIEEKNLLEIRDQPRLFLPFGYQNSKWEEVKLSVQELDEIWEFSSPKKSWKLLAGRAGVCVVRNGEVIDGIVTIKN